MKRRTVNFFLAKWLIHMQGYDLTPNFPSIHLQRWVLADRLFDQNIYINLDQNI